MQDDWIIDVLADLCAFAHANNLPHLAAKIEEASRVAVAELATDQMVCLAALPEDVSNAGRDLRPIGSGQHAR